MISSFDVKLTGEAKNETIGERCKKKKKKKRERKRREKKPPQQYGQLRMDTQSELGLQRTEGSTRPRQSNDQRDISILENHWRGGRV